MRLIVLIIVIFSVFITSCSKDEIDNIDFDYNRITGNYIASINGLADSLNHHNIEMTLVRDEDIYYFLSDKQLYDPVANLKFELIPCFVDNNGSYYTYKYANINLILNDNNLQSTSSYFHSPVDLSNHIRYWDHFRGDGGSFSITFHCLDSLETYSTIKISGDRDY